MNIRDTLHNQISNDEEFTQMISSCITHDDNYLLLPNGGSSNGRGTSIDIPHSNDKMSYEDSQFVHGESSRGRIKDTSLLADANSSFLGVSYLPRTCGQVYPKGNGRQDDQLPSPNSYPQMMMPTHRALVTPLMKYNNVTFSHPQQLPSQVPIQFRSYDPVTGSTLHQPNLAQNQQQNQAPLLCVSSLQKPPMPFHPPHQMLNNSLKQLAPSNAVSGSMCLRQLMYLIHQQQNRPQDNNIGFWRKLVEQYYSPVAKKRHCLSMTSMHNINLMKHWVCKLCGKNSGEGFEISYELLPRMSQEYFESCVDNELLFLDSPIETPLPLGSMMLTFNNVVQQGIYMNFRMSHQGQLRIVFTRDLKILSWEFCVQSHENFISHNSVTTQVNEFVKIAKNCKGNKEYNNETNGVSEQDQVTNCNRLMAAGEKLATNFELPNINEAGFSKKYVRYMHMSDVIHSMKDLIGMCAESQSNNFSPIEAMKRLHQESILKKHMERTSQMPQVPSVSGSSTHNQGVTSKNQINNHLVNVHTNRTNLPNGGSQDKVLSNPDIGTQVMQSVELKNDEAMQKKDKSSIILSGMVDKDFDL